MIRMMGTNFEMSQLHILLPSGFIDRKIIYFRLLITVTKPFVGGNTVIIHLG